MKLPIHFQTSSVAPLKLVNGYVISYTLYNGCNQSSCRLFSADLFTQRTMLDFDGILICHNRGTVLYCYMTQLGNFVLSFFFGRLTTEVIARQEECAIVQYQLCSTQENHLISTRSQRAKLIGPTWGPPEFCRPQMGPILAPWALLSGVSYGAGKHKAICLIAFIYSFLSFHKHDSIILLQEMIQIIKMVLTHHIFIFQNYPFL